MRDGFFEVVNRLDNDSVGMLAGNYQVSKRLLENPIYQPTFNGFVKGGSMNGRVKYRVDPPYSAEFPLYSKQNAFSMPKLLQDGLTKQGFFKVAELADAINIYNQKNLGQIINGKRLGEIIFIKKVDGTTILTPRYSDASLPLPHPYLAAGEDVVAAGTVIPDLNDNKIILIDNATGHYKVHKDDMLIIIKEFENYGYKVINNSK